MMQAAGPPQNALKFGPDIPSGPTELSPRASLGKTLVPDLFEHSPADILPPRSCEPKWRNWQTR